MISSMAFGYASCCDVIICILYCYEILIYTHSAGGTFLQQYVKTLDNCIIDWMGRAPFPGVMHIP